MKYGLPYKGSKNKLALRINQLLPKADHLIDLFCGGCAVPHAALMMDKFQHIHINDVDWRPVQLFTDSLAGKYENENRWISREDFFRLKDVDPYVAIVWSFGNDMRTYMYGREIEEIKRSLHYAIYFADYAPAKALGYDLSFLDGMHDVYKRYIATKRFFQEFHANYVDEIGDFTPTKYKGGAGVPRKNERTSNFPGWRISKGMYVSPPPPESSNFSIARAGRNNQGGGTSFRQSLPSPKFRSHSKAQKKKNRPPYVFRFGLSSGAYS